MELSIDTRARISILREEGYSLRAIATRLRVSLGAVQKTINRFKASGVHKTRPRSGRPRATSVRTDNMMRRIVSIEPNASAAQIKSRLPHDVSVGVHTIRKRLRHDFGLLSYRPAAKPLLSAKNVRDRLTFCRAHRHWTSEDWSQVMFSDETLIRQFSSRVSHIRRPANQRYNPRYVKPCVKQSPSLMVWGAISANGRAGIHIMPPGQTVNAARYLVILQEKLPTWLPLRNCSIFQQDGAPCHQARVVKNWFETQGIQLLDPWPGSSPDLNPIENCWSILKNKIVKLNPTSINDLTKKIYQIWTTEITTEYCKSLIDSMPKRIIAVLNAKGHYSKY